MKSNKKHSAIGRKPHMRVINCIKENGLIYTVKYAGCVLLNIIRCGIQKRKYTRLLCSITPSKRVFLWTEYFGWNIALFQRPQHIARCLAKFGNTVFYYTTPAVDADVKDIKEISPNLYLVNRDNTVFSSMLEKYLENLTCIKYVHTYSTLGTTVEEIKNYEKKGFSVFYEYVDDLSPELTGTKEVPTYLLEKYNYVMKDSHIPIAVTADLLKKQVMEMRGELNLVQSSNGVDINHFADIKENFVFNEQFTNVLKNGKKIVGYYGALAQWLDYDLLIHVAKKLLDIDIVLIGKVYDESYAQAQIHEIPNIHFIGPVPYQELPQYANRFDICTIPFKVNSITNATSPLKLFEYMALNKPVLTTAMQESSKYKAVNIAKTYDDFVEKITTLLEFTPENNPEYYALLKETVEQNTWDAKTELILNMLEKYEKR